VRRNTAVADRPGILPDLARRTPVVDPDDHHLFVSLGCAAENFLIAAATSGRPGVGEFVRDGNGRIQIDLAAGKATDRELCAAIRARQSTRSDDDGRELASSKLYFARPTLRLF